MDVFENPDEFLSIASGLLLLLMCSNRALLAVNHDDAEDEYMMDVRLMREYAHLPPAEANSNAVAALHSFRLWTSLQFLGDNLGFWVKPRSTTWFSRFVLEEYDDDRWVQLFRMTKTLVFSLADILKPLIVKRDTNYRLAIPVVVRLCCILFSPSSSCTGDKHCASWRNLVASRCTAYANGIRLLPTMWTSWSCGCHRRHSHRYLKTQSWTCRLLLL